jgi:hypothetical protein
MTVSLPRFFHHCDVSLVVDRLRAVAGVFDDLALPLVDQRRTVVMGCATA